MEPCFANVRIAPAYNNSAPTQLNYIVIATGKSFLFREGFFVTCSLHLAASTQYILSTHLQFHAFNC